MLAAAADGSLGTSQGLGKQVDRLLQTDAVKQNINNVVVSWFNVPQLVIKTKDPSLIPAAVAAMVPTGQDVQATLESDILTSTTDFVDDVIWKGTGKVTELLTSNKLFVNQRLAALYGLPYDATSAGVRADGFLGVADPQPRAGMITQPGFLWSLSDPATTSIVHRGKEIHDYVVCGNALKPPPPGLLSSPAIIQLLANLPTELDKANYRLGDIFCASCHQSMDTYGLMLEKLDPVGNHRDDVCRRGQRSGSDQRERRLLAVPQGGAAEHADHRAGRVRSGDRRQPPVHRLRGHDDGQLRARALRGLDRARPRRQQQHRHHQQHLRGRQRAWPVHPRRRQAVDAAEASRDRCVPPVALRRLPVTSYKVSRRAFLRGCGASTLMLPLLRNIEARAQGKPAPLRFLVIHHSLGTQLGLCWRPRPWRPPVQATTTSFALPVNSAPFTPLQPKMVMIDGVNIVGDSKAPGREGNFTHEGGMVAIMTGQPNLGLAPNSQADFVAGGPSIDQILLAQSPVLGGPMSPTRTPFQSLQLAADVRSDRDEVAPRTLSYGAAQRGGADIVSQRNPLAPETRRC